MSARLTDWFPADVKPALRGVYERDDRGTFMYDGHRNYSHWDGTHWGGSETSPLRAWNMRANVSCEQSLPWRGLAEDPDRAAQSASHDTGGKE